ncbi:MAG TPA: SPFH domain-containing protein [Anaerolineales bacterium]|jgi:hypothetical protein
MYSRRFARSLWDRIISFLVDRAFVTVRAGALVRKWSLIVLGGLFWILIAWIAHPLVLGAEPLRNTIEYPIQALFAADVFKHIVIAALAFWVAYRIAAIYLDDIFELKNVPLAARFIRQTAFATQYDLIEIKDGKVAKEHQESPILLIGGPGLVRVYLENAALFERIDGSPRIIPPTVRVSSQEQPVERRPAFLARLRRRPARQLATRRDGSNALPADGVEILEGFDRLRSVIDLRDQVVSLNVFGRTRDGIQVRAENVRLVFSVYRGNKEPTLEHPYPFEKDAVETLVYDNPPQNWAMTMESLIRTELGNFIAEHTLGEFLAAINTPEIEEQVQEHVALQEEANQLAGVEATPSVEALTPPPFVPRTRMIDPFYDFTSRFSKKARSQGVELRWIGVGTWVTPDEIIPARHQNAWRITSENIARGSDEAMHRVQEESRLRELVSLVKEVPLKAFKQLENDDSEPRNKMRKLADAYRGKLRAALDLYQRDAGEESSEAYRLRCVLIHMSRAVFHWLGDRDGGS